MQHHPSSSSSADLTASEIVSRFRLRLLSLRARRSPPDVRQKMPAAPLKPRRISSRRRSATSQYLLPTDFNEIKDPIEKDRITKCATLAIQDYNSQTQNHYQLVVIDEFISQMVNGFLYIITFQAMNADKEYATFEAYVYSKRDLRLVIDFIKVIQIGIKGTSTWYKGILLQLEDDAPIVMDVKDHKGGVYEEIYSLVKSTQQLRMPDVGTLVIKKDVKVMELNKPSVALQKMQHHPSSSSFADLTDSEIVSRYRLRLSRLGPFARRSPPPDVHQKMPAAPLKPRRRSAIRQSLLPCDFNQIENRIENQIEKDRLIKCVTLAIRDYNSQTRNDYQLVVNDEFISQMVNCFLYRITFQAMNADKEYATFEAHVYGFGKRDYDYLNLRKFFRIRMEGTSTWYNGTLMQLEDGTPSVMDEKDYNRDVYGLVKSAQQLRMPDVGSLVIKQDEGEEAA
ncbi:uncharacterized protein [Medicago truncatula]|nr:uncharacterized protein LOC11419096 [Medicago truncatula]